MRPKLVNYVAMESASSLVWCGESQSGIKGVFRMNTLEAGSEESHLCLLQCSSSADAEPAPTTFVWNRRLTMIAVACGSTVLIAPWSTTDAAARAPIQKVAAPPTPSDDDTPEVPSTITHVAFDCVDDMQECVFFATTTNELHFSVVDLSEASERATSPTVTHRFALESPLLHLTNSPNPTKHHRCFMVSKDASVVGVTVVEATPAPENVEEAPEGASPLSSWSVILTTPVPLSCPDFTNASAPPLSSCREGPFQSQLLASDHGLIMMKCLWEGECIRNDGHHLTLPSISIRGDVLHLGVWDPWSRSGACVVGFWTLDRCFCVHRVCLDEGGAVTENHLLGELSPFADDGSVSGREDDVVWCGALGASKSLTVARRLAGFVGLEALYEENMSKAGSSPPPAAATGMAQPAATDEADLPPRQASEDTVMVADELPEADEPALETSASAVPTQEQTSSNAPAEAPLGGEVGTSDAISTSAALSDEPQQVASQPATAPQLPPSSTIPHDDETLPQGAATTKPAPEVHAKVRRRAATPPLPEVEKKPAVPRLAEKLRQERRVLAASKPRRTAPPADGAPQDHATSTSANSEAIGTFVGQSGVESKASLPPRGPGVEVALDTSDLSQHRDKMDVYVLTKLLGEGWETPVIFLPLQVNFKLPELRSTLEQIHARRLSITFATPAGKLIELRPSTMRIFESYDDDSKQIYCRGLFPKIEGGHISGTDTNNMRAQSALETESSRKQNTSLGPRASTPHFPDVSAISHGGSHLSESTMLFPPRKLSKDEQAIVSRRLHETSVELSRTKLSALEKKFWPTENGAKKIAADTTVDMIDRLYRQSNEIKGKKLVELQKAVDIQLFGSKPPLQLPEDERKVVAEKFYDMGVKQVKKLETLAEQRAHPRAQCPKLATPEEWAAWQESMARPIKRRFKSKDPYVDPS